MREVVGVRGTDGTGPGVPGGGAWVNSCAAPRWGAARWISPPLASFAAASLGGGGLDVTEGECGCGEGFRG